MNGLHNGKTNLGLEDSFHNDLHGNRKLSFSDVNAKIKPVLRTSNSEAQIQGLLYALDSSVENLGDAEGRNLILPPNTRNFLRRFLQDSRGHLSTRDASCNTTVSNKSWVYGREASALDTDVMLSMMIMMMGDISLPLRRRLVHVQKYQSISEVRYSYTSQVNMALNPFKLVYEFLLDNGCKEVWFTSYRKNFAKENEGHQG
ncbi:hypothetical protein CLF_108693 [Clonorchis sinensis]|uniref:Uncharacterized protein n=1 Tax=Clonorchis sinensis TaxID=79923 RepID=G7YIF5_CLOSI|nr:hypothetical protein CLF_108693 [Clonorchis sinensis]